MKNGIRKITAIGSGVCFLALWFVFLLFAIKPYTEKIVIWLPDNYEMENYVKDEVVSIMPTPIDNSHQSNKVFYAVIGMESFKRLFGNSEKVVSVKIEEKIEDTGYSNPSYYQIIYQVKHDCADKSFIVVAQEYYRYNKRTLSEMRLSQDQDALFLKNKRNADLICTLLIAGFVMVALSVYLFEFVDKHPKQSND